MKTKVIIICLALCLLAAIFFLVNQSSHLTTQDLYVKLQWSHKLVLDLKEDDKIPQEDIAQLSLLWLWASSYWMEDDLVNTDRLLRQFGDYYFDIVEPQLYQGSTNITWEKGLPSNSTIIRIVPNG
jgi:hypothetical protein